MAEESNSHRQAAPEGPDSSHSFVQEFKKNLRKDLRKPKTYVELAALIFLVLYTCETRRTNNLTKLALSTSEKQFVLSQTTSKDQFLKDQRPYIWPMKLEPAKPIIGQSVKANVFLANYGKTPALKMRSVGTVLLPIPNVHKTVMELAEDFFAHASPNSAEGYESIMPQGVPSDPHKSANWFTAESSVIPKTGKYLRALTDNEVEVIVGRTLYTDSAGTEYRTDYCVIPLHNGNQMWCPTHNEIQ
jgi:hypothetical protein